jgi:phosphoribosylanthranilate isomerase
MKKLIKVCGMTDGDNIREVEALGVDMIGLIFFPRSPRYVSSMPSYLPTRVKRVGVFVNASAEYVLSKVEAFSLDYVQLHGEETPSFCESLGLGKERIIKAFQISSTSDLAECEKYLGCSSLFIFDTKSPLVGGSGKQFDWRVLNSYSLKVPFLLSGGIGPEFTTELSLFEHPMLAGYDLNSRFEIRPGLKNIKLLDKFLKEYEQN